ncbi:hypothetical protein Anas_05090 [Armadillidium nasatum]|uniref:CHK kinase-like domain-containing protein n=1 Tax=Armadillidium nasatum TaxID=96803 RepID=A0A5N5T2C6_9CRUS|nr:hypothetical protein Anas_05090 [Armadillidium nasatum]
MVNISSCECMPWYVGVFRIRQRLTEEHWFDANCKYYTHVFDKTIISQVLGAIKYLSTIPKYEKCAKWLNENKQNLSQYFLEGFKSSKPLEVLIHGDCWTNNLLFKYNSKNTPVDLRLVDLQVSRLASPGSDINYFVYTSLTGDTRSKYFHDLLEAYYQSFSKVLILSRRKLPFTFKELEDDVERTKIVGLVIGLLAIPGIFFEGEDEIFDFGEMTEENMEEIFH